LLRHQVNSVLPAVTNFYIVLKHGDKAAQPRKPFVHPRYAPFERHAAQAALKENSVADDVQKNQGQNPGQSGQQSGQQQQKNPQDVSKKDPSQDRNKEHDDRQGNRNRRPAPRFLGLGPGRNWPGLYLLRKSSVY
jgi:hypothetical protein